MLYGGIEQNKGEYKGLLLNNKGWVIHEASGPLASLVKGNLERYASKHNENITWTNPIISKNTKKKKKYYRPNPPKGAVKIYDNVIEIRAQKDAKDSLFPGDLFKHPFKGSTNVCVYGLPDGTLRIIGDKPLWKYFEY